MTLRFVVMKNLFSPAVPLYESFDLKGSTIDRSVLDKLEYWNPNFALKDKDLHLRIKVGPSLKAQILEQLENDTKWLASLNVCDYSLLIGIAYINEPIPDSQTSLFNDYCGGIISRDSKGQKRGPEMYFIGLIDTLTTYDFKKYGEHVLKSIIHDSNEISAISPEPYRKRLLRFASKILD